MLYLFVTVGPILLFVWQLHLLKQIHLLTPLQVSQFCSGMACYIAFIIMRLLLLKKRDSRWGLDAEKLKIPQRHFGLLFWVIFKPL